MGRIRTIKPELLTDAKTARLGDAAWRLFVSSLVLADDAGNLPGDPVILGGQVFPTSPKKAEAALAELLTAGLFVAYRVRGQDFVHIPGFQKHQRINRPSGPKYPTPGEADGGLTEGSVRAHGGSDEDSMLTTISIATTTATAIASATGKPRRRAEARELPPDWSPTESHTERAKAAGLDLAEQAERFRLHAETHGRRAVNWNAAFTAWLLNAPRFARGTPARGTPAVPDRARELWERADRLEAEERRARGEA